MRRLLQPTTLRRGPRLPLMGARIAAACAIALLLVPGAATGGTGGSSSILTLLESIAGHSRELAGLLDTTNQQMARVETQLAEIRALDEQMTTLVDQTGSLQTSTDSLAGKLAGVNAKIDAQGTTLARVARQVRSLGGRMTTLQASVAGQLSTTRAMSGDFNRISGRMRAMAGDFNALIRQMGLSRPEVSYFSQNELDKSYPGGDSAKYGALNLAPGKTRVMSIMLPMITQLQRGGDLIGKKISQTADAEIVGNLLKESVPDGTNVLSSIIAYDGRYGLPASDWFVRHRVNGF